VGNSFSDAFLQNLCGDRNFIWHCKEPNGRSGGILLGIDLDVFYIGAIDEEDFYVKFTLCNKCDCFRWSLIAIYGLAQNDKKEAFLLELVQMARHETLPILIGGDFNILRGPHEKNKGLFG
jgi:hypothetical protein